MILEIGIFVFVSEKPRKSLGQETTWWKTLYLCLVSYRIACSPLPSSNKQFLVEMKEFFVSNFVYFFLTCSFEVQENLRLLYQTILRQMLGKHAKKPYEKKVSHSSSECTKIFAKLLLHSYMHVQYVVSLLHEISFQSFLVSLQTVRSWCFQDNIKRKTSWRTFHFSKRQSPFIRVYSS